MRGGIFNSNKQFLTNNICNKMLLGNINVIGHPENANFIKERKYDIGDRLIDAFHADIMIKYIFKTIAVQVHHMVEEIIDKPFDIRLSLRQLEYFLTHFSLVHFIDVRDLV